MSVDLNIRIGQVVSDKRKEKRMSQSELGRRLGICRESVWKHETGIHAFKALDLLRAMRELDIDIHEIYEALGFEEQFLIRGRKC